jgi:ankyrin repeat protein
MQDNDPNVQLFCAIAFSDQPGVPSQVQDIEVAYTRGADLNRVSKEGETPLTHAILGGMGSPKAVKKLLELGADPSKRDSNGWTPWGACITQIENPVVVDRMQKIRELLLAYAADQSDEIILKLQQAVQAQNLAEAEALLQAGVDPNAPIIDPLYVAIANQDLAMIQLLLRYNVNPNGRPNEPMPYLLKAAEIGNLEIVQQLVNAGADVTQYGWDNEQYTAEFCARHQGHDFVAAWLQSVTSAEIVAEQQRKIEARNPKFQELYEKQTNGINCDLTTDDIVQRLEQWNVLYSIEISDVENDGLVVRFASLPDDLSEFAREIYEFCPDTIDQHFGCMDDMVNTMGAEALPPELAELIEGINFEDESFGKVLLQRSLERSKQVSLWWD